MTPTDEQRAAIETRAARALVVACPGSGKTEVIVRRVVHLVGQGVRPTDIAVITYTNAAARVVERRLNDDSGFVGPLGYVGTLHGFCVRHLAHFGPWRHLRVMDEEDADALLARVGKQVSPGAPWSKLAECRANWLVEESQPETPVRIAVARYHAEMSLTGEVDYDTLLRWTITTLANPELVRRSWAHLIVDEFQDAAKIDALIYEAAEADNRFYVGDPMQSIFAFRGGDVREIERLASTPGWVVLELTTNFRSLPGVCDALNNLAKAAHGGSRKPVRSFAAEGGGVRTRYFDDEAEEAEGIALAVQHMAVNSQVQQPITTDAIAAAIAAAAGKFAVLARSNRIADRIADEMRLRGVPVCQMRRLDQPKDWKLAMAALGVLARPRSAASRRRLKERGGKAAPDGLTGHADKMPTELSMLGAGVESIARIWKRFEELPTSADLRDLELSLALDPVARQMEGTGCFVGTIHAAKGQEWDTVVVAAFEDQVIPGSRKSADVDEERRLAYVAISRARLQVVLSWAAFRGRPGTSRLFPQDLSRFAEEAAVR